MRAAVRSGRFRRDVKLMRKRGKDMSKLRNVLTLLLAAAPLPASFKDHALTGDWKGHRDCHIEPDWLLIYRIDGNDLVLERTGTHADLFR